MTAATSGLFIATFLACFVEAVEAATIVMALGFTRGWRSTLYGIVAALVTLVVVSSILRLAIIDIVPVVGTPGGHRRPPPDLRAPVDA